jgi:hypothetical protein
LDVAFEVIEKLFKGNELVIGFQSREMAVVTFAALIVVTNPFLTRAATAETVLLAVHAWQERFGQFPHRDLDDGPVVANLLGAREWNRLHMVAI